MDHTMASKVSICNLINSEITTHKSFEFKNELLVEPLKNVEGVSFFNALLARTVEHAQWVDDNATSDQKTALWNQFSHVFNGYLEYSATLFGKKISLELLSQNTQNVFPLQADEEEEIGRTFKNANFQFSKFLKELNLRNSKRIYAIEALYASIFLSGCRTELPSDSTKDLPPERKSSFRKEQFQQALNAESPTAFLIQELVRWVNELDVLPEQSKRMIWKACSSIWCFGNFDRKSFRRTIKKWRSSLLDNVHNIFILSDVLCHHSLTDLASSKTNSWRRILRVHSKVPTDLPSTPVTPQGSSETSFSIEKDESLRLPPIDQLMLSLEHQKPSKPQEQVRSKPFPFASPMSALTSILQSSSEPKVELPSLQPASEPFPPPSPSVQNNAPSIASPSVPNPNIIQMIPAPAEANSSPTLSRSSSLNNLALAASSAKGASTNRNGSSESLSLMSSIIQSPQTLSMIFNSERIRHRQKRSFWKTIQPPPAPQPVVQNTKMARRTV